MKSIFLFWLTGLSSLVSLQAVAQKTWHQQLEGLWHGAAGDQQIVEQWQPMANGNLEGKGGIIAKGDTVWFERIYLQGDGPIKSYKVEIDGREPVEFRLIEYAENRFHWQNPHNDFPSDLIYQFIDNEKLRIILKGGLRSDTLLFTRIK